MLSFIARRLLQFVPVLFLCSVIIFVGVRMLPGDAATMMGGPNPTPETIQNIRESLGLDQPLFVQYGLWVKGLATGDLGLSFTSNRPISGLLAQRLPPTILLAIVGMVASIVLGGVLGLLAGLHPGSTWDKFVSAYSSLTLSIPSFVVAILLVLAFSIKLRWLPVSGQARTGADLLAQIRHLLLPTLTLAVANAPIIARFFQASIKETLAAEFVTAARAKGLPMRVIVRDYIVRNSLIPVITASGIIFGNLLGGVTIVEVIFAWPGIGSLMVDALGDRDYGVVQAVIVVVVLGFLLANLAVDILCGLVDPRVQSAQSR